MLVLVKCLHLLHDLLKRKKKEKKEKKEKKFTPKEREELTLKAV